MRLEMPGPSTANRAPVIFLLLMMFVAVCNAQDYVSQTGSPAFSANQPVVFGFVNLANGNIHLEIPIASAPQRGELAFALKLVYDSRIWQVVKPAEVCCGSRPMCRTRWEDGGLSAAPIRAP